MNLKDKYAIVGIGYTAQGKVPQRTALSFYVEAGANAIKDAGLSREDIDGLICYRHFPPASGEPDPTPYRVAQQLRLNPKLLSQEANCARTQLQHAVWALEAGLCRYVLIIYADNSLDNKIYLNNFVDNVNNIHSWKSTNFWNSTDRINYQYNNVPYIRYIGNFWSGYSGLDPFGDGLGDDPYLVFKNEWDYNPLRFPSENYVMNT